MNPEIQALRNKINELENKLSTLSSDFKKHQHDGLDGTNQLRKSIKLDADQYLQVGLGGQGTGNTGETTGQIQYALSVGKDDKRTGFVNKADILQLDFLHQPAASTSFIVSRRTPVVTSSLSGATISVSSGGSTVTINGYNFTTNELANAIICIFNSSGTFVEAKSIASNTSTVVTITGTWGATTSDGFFEIYKPSYLGSAEFIWQRFYTQEGTAGGIRFGIGPTWTSGTAQNGLLYMDSSGDLYWRNKSGTSVKLN